MSERLAAKKKPKRRYNQITISRHSPLFAGYNKYYFGAKISPPLKSRKSLLFRPTLGFYISSNSRQNFRAVRAGPKSGGLGLGYEGQGLKLKPRGLKSA